MMHNNETYSHSFAMYLTQIDIRKFVVFGINLLSCLLQLGFIFTAFYVIIRWKTHIGTQFNNLAVSIIAAYLYIVQNASQQLFKDEIANSVWVGETVLQYILTFLMVFPVFQYEYKLAQSQSIEINHMPFGPCLHPQKTVAYWKYFYSIFASVCVFMVSCDIIDRCYDMTQLFYFLSWGVAIVYTIYILFYFNYMAIAFLRSSTTRFCKLVAKYNLTLIVWITTIILIQEVIDLTDVADVEIKAVHNYLECILSVLCSVFSFTAIRVIKIFSNQMNDEGHDVNTCTD